MKADWIVEHGTMEGMKYYIVRIPVLEHLCGYLALPVEHPLYGLGYDDERISNLDVHGGITLAGSVDDYGWLIGFDCAHADDSHRYLRALSYKDEDFVRNQLKELRNQLK